MNPSLIPSRAVLGFALVFSLLLSVLQAFQEHLLYRRELVLAGEAWRLLTANLVHTNANHLALNLAGLWTFILLTGTVLNLKILNFSIMFTGLFITTALFLFHPSIQWYVGFSGILYGLFIIGGVLLALNKEWLTCIALLVLIALRLGISGLDNTDLSTTQLINAPVLIEAHLYGALGGLICGLTIIYAHWQAGKNHAKLFK